MNLYLYCVMSAEDELPPLTGIQNQPVHTMDLESLRVVVSDFTGTELTPNKEAVLTHERVVEGCMDRTTPLPFRFGVVIGEKKLAEFVRNNAPSLLHDLEQVYGSVEMGLKVMIPAAKTGKPLTGTDFLNVKRQRQEMLKRTVEWVDAAVVGIIRRTEMSLVEGTQSTIVRIAHLVRHDHLDEYKAHIAALVRQRTDCRFLRSGPWPPYSFISTARLD